MRAWLKVHKGFVTAHPQVRIAILNRIPGISNCADVTSRHLAAITYLDLENQGITSLTAYDFAGLSSLTRLGLQRQQFEQSAKWCL